MDPNEAIPVEPSQRARMGSAMPEALRRRVYGGLAYTATPLAPIASYLLWRQFQEVGNMSSLWMAIAYGALSILLPCSLVALWMRRTELAVKLFAYPAALMLGFQLSVSSQMLVAVTITEMLLLFSICFVVMEEEDLKLFGTVQLSLALASWVARAWIMPAPLAFPAWELFNKQVIPLAIFLVFQVAILFMAVQLKRLLAENNQALASLKSQREELARKNDDLRLFFYAASHDLRQPLRQVLGFARLLEKKHKASLADEAKEYLGFIEQVSGRMEGLLDSLLHYASLSTKPLELGTVDLNLSLEHAVQDVKLDLGRAQAQFDFGPLPVVEGQASLLEDVLKNLLDNSAKYRHPDRVLVLKVWAQEVEGGWQLSVDDNGIGVPENLRAGLFQVFHRGHPIANYPGYGIGLAYCRRVLELHGGWIRLGDKEGPGALMELFLPRVLPAQVGGMDSPGLSSH